LKTLFWVRVPRQRWRIGWQQTNRSRKDQ
jgi:hypothetical protein